MKSTTTEKTLEVLRSLFARYGLPRQLVSDNGPQFTAKQFEECMLANGVKHIKSPPYHPATNGEAERFVQTFKRSLRAGRGDEGSVHQKLSQFLLTYRTTPQATTGVSPSELFLKRTVRTRLDLLKPSVEEYVLEKQEKQKRYHDEHSWARCFQVNQAVLVRNLREGPKWLRGVIVRQLGSVTYEVRVGGQVWKRHIDQLLEYKDQPMPESDVAPPPEEEEIPTPPTPMTPTLPPPVSPETAMAEAAMSSDTPVVLPAVEPPPETNDDSQVTPQTPIQQPSPASCPRRNLRWESSPKSYPRRERRPPDYYEPPCN